MISIGDILRVAVTGTSPGAGVFQNVWHLEMATGADPDPGLVLAAISDNWELAFAEIDARVAGDYSWDLFELWQRDTINQRWDGVAVEDIVNVGGGSVNDPHPHGVAALGRVITDSFRRQGRHFMPGLTDEQFEVGLLVSAALVDLADYMVQFAEGITADGSTFGWVTYNTEPTSVLFQTASRYVGAVIANNIAAYQRRRKPLVGI